MLPPPARALDLALRRLTAQTVARQNARAAWLDMARGRRERREVEEFLEAHLDLPAQRAAYSMTLPRPQEG